MKLQVNNSGAWKNVIVFDAKDMDVVRLGANSLGAAAALAGSAVTWRILDGADQVIAYWTVDSLWEEKVPRGEVCP